MKNVVWAIVAVGALAALGCEDKKPEAKPSTGATPAATATAAPAKTAAPGGGW
jgi:hypothetical protein